MPFTYSRRPSQWYIFVNEEPPTTETRVNMAQLDGFFNLTATFRSDSDIVWPYGIIEKMPTSSSKESTSSSYAQGKTKLVAWFVSNCQSESMREKYVDSLKKYIPVDVYGSCGNLTCWAGDQDSCYAMLERDYKFFLSFENSFCVMILN